MWRLLVLWKGEKKEEGKGKEERERKRLNLHEGAGPLWMRNKEQPWKGGTMGDTAYRVSTHVSMTETSKYLLDLWYL
jgi:hypothetical protein